MADLGFADEESNFDNESVMGGAAGDDHDETSSTLNRAPKRLLTEIEDEADQQEQETPAGTDDDEKEEDEDEEVQLSSTEITRSGSADLELAHSRAGV